VHAPWRGAQTHIVSFSLVSTTPSPNLLLPPPPTKKTQEGIDKLVRLLENDNEAQFNAEQYMQLYT
jgi:hypothetical protein